MSRVGPLVLLTKTSIDDKQNDGANAAKLRYTWMAPRKKHEEEIQRQAYAALRASKDDFVVLLGDRVETYKRRHKPSDFKSNKQDVGLESAPNKPYVAHGGTPDDPTHLSTRFRFPPGHEAEKKRKAAAKREDMANQPSPHPPGSPRSPLQGSFPSLKKVISARRASQIEEGSLRADAMLELMFMNPARAQAIKNRQNKIGNYFEQPDSSTGGNLSLTTSSKNRAPESEQPRLFRDFGFPKAELQKSHKRVGLMRKGETFIHGIDPQSNVEDLFPPVNVQLLVTHPGGAVSKEAVKFFVTEMAEQEPIPQTPRSGSRKSRQSLNVSVTFAGETSERSPKSPKGLRSPLAKDSSLAGPIAHSPNGATQAMHAKNLGREVSYIQGDDDGLAPDPISSKPRCYRNYVMEQFDDTKPSTLESTVYWRVRLDHMKHRLQNQLMSTLEAREENREKVYTSANDLAVLSKAGQAQALQWQSCRKVTNGGPESKDIWTARTEVINQKHQLLLQKRELYQRLMEYIPVIGEADELLQTSMDHVRRGLIELDTLDKKLLKEALQFFVIHPEAVTSKGVWALFHFLRNELNVDVFELADMATAMALDLPPEQLGLVRSGDLLRKESTRFVPA